MGPCGRSLGLWGMPSKGIVAPYSLLLVPFHPGHEVTGFVTPTTMHYAANHYGLGLPKLWAKINVFLYKLIQLFCYSNGKLTNDDLRNHLIHILSTWHFSQICTSLSESVDSFLSWSYIFLSSFYCLKHTDQAYFRGKKDRVPWKRSSQQPIILATWEAEIRNMEVPDQPMQKSSWDPISKGK
jgi:hypothetical protein